MRSYIDGKYVDINEETGEITWEGDSTANIDNLITVGKKGKTVSEKVASMGSVLKSVYNKVSDPNLFGRNKVAGAMAARPANWRGRSASANSRPSLFQRGVVPPIGGRIEEYTERRLDNVPQELSEEERAQVNEYLNVEGAMPRYEYISEENYIDQERDVEDQMANKFISGALKEEALARKKAEIAALKTDYPAKFRKEEEARLKEEMAQMAMPRKERAARLNEKIAQQAEARLAKQALAKEWRAQRNYEISQRFGKKYIGRIATPTVIGRAQVAPMMKLAQQMFPQAAGVMSMPMEAARVGGKGTGKGRGRPRGTYKYGMPIQVYKRSLSRQKAQARALKMIQMNRAMAAAQMQANLNRQLQKRGITAQQYQQIQQQRFQQAQAQQMAEMPQVAQRMPQQGMLQPRQRVIMRQPMPNYPPQQRMFQRPQMMPQQAQQQIINGQIVPPGYRVEKDLMSGRDRIVKGPSRSSERWLQ